MEDGIDLVLDLDETLVSAEYCSNIIPATYPRPPDFTLRVSDQEKIAVWKRPHLDELMEWLFRDPASARVVRSVSVFSYGAPDYVHFVCKNLIPEKSYRGFTNIWARPQCTVRKSRDGWGMYTSYSFTTPDVRKRLVKYFRRRKLHPERTLMVDDTPSVMMGNHGNGVVVPKFEIDETSDPYADDPALPDLREFLEKLGPTPNIRKMCKCYGVLECCIQKCLL